MHRTTVASASARTPTSISGTAHTRLDNTSEQQAFAMLEATSAANLAAFYVRKGNLAAAKRKAVVLLKSLQVLEVSQ